MKTIHWHQAEIIELDHTDNYYAIIDMQTSKHGLRCNVILEGVNAASRLVVATYVTKEFNISEAREYALGVLSNGEMCDKAWERHTGKN